MKRLNLEAQNADEAINYLNNRAVQMLKFGVKFVGLKIHDEAVVGTLEYDGQGYQSIYVFDQHRGQGLYKRLFEELELPVLTSDECELEGFLKAKNYPYVCFTIEEFPEYKLIQQHYGDGKARRSGVYFMNHIDEGLAVLNWRGASEEAKKAFCLHPIFQSDEDLARSHEVDLTGIDPKVVVNAMEYRSVANEYLSRRVIGSINEIRLSPLADVNAMLVADKVQNRKDFERFHQEHSRHDALAEYFRNWMRKLGVSEGEYEDFKSRLTLPDISISLGS